MVCQSFCIRGFAGSAIIRLGHALHAAGAACEAVGGRLACPPTPTPSRAERLALSLAALGHGVEHAAAAAKTWAEACDTQGMDDATLLSHADAGLVRLACQQALRTGDRSGIERLAAARADKAAVLMAFAREQTEVDQRLVKALATGFPPRVRVAVRAGGRIIGLPAANSQAI